MVRISRNPASSPSIFTPQKPHQYCIFEHVCFARPDSIIFGRSVNASREALGRVLAREHPVDADIVVPCPRFRRSRRRGLCAPNRKSHFTWASFAITTSAVLSSSLRKPSAISASSSSSIPCADSSKANASSSSTTPSCAAPPAAKSRAHGARSQCQGSSRAHQLSADGFAVLLRHVDTPTKEELIASSNTPEEICQLPQRRFAGLRLFACVASRCR